MEFGASGPGKAGTAGCWQVTLLLPHLALG